MTSIVAGYESHVCDSCKFKIRYSRNTPIGDKLFYCDVVCGHPSINDIIPIPERCKSYECKYHKVSKDQKTLGV